MLGGPAAAGDSEGPCGRIRANEANLNVSGSAHAGRDVAGAQDQMRRLSVIFHQQPWPSALRVAVNSIIYIYDNSIMPTIAPKANCVSAVLAQDSTIVRSGYIALCPINRFV